MKQRIYILLLLILIPLQMEAQKVGLVLSGGGAKGLTHIGFIRALEENAAIVSACNLQQIADFSNIHPSSLVFAGGGSKGKLWSQILADVSGLPVNIPVV